MPTMVSMVTLDSILLQRLPSDEKKHRLSFSPDLYSTPVPSHLVPSLLSPSSPSPYVSTRSLLHPQEDHLHDDRHPKSVDNLRCSLAVADDDFLDLDPSGVDTESVASGGGLADCFSTPKDASSCRAEFFDADEDFLSDGSTSSPLRTNIVSEISNLRVSLLEEVGKRKTAEESLVHMQMQWKSAASQFAKVGLSFPPIAIGLELQEIDDSIAQVCQEVVVSRFVSNALGRGVARAEAETSAEEVIKSKNCEIARLQNRLQYYKAVNNELCQLIQDDTESSRQRRQRRHQRKKWVWSFVGISLSIGASMLAYSYLPYSHVPLKEDQSLFSSLEPHDSLNG